MKRFQLYISLLVGGLFVALFSGMLLSNSASIHAQPSSISACANGGDYSTIQSAVNAVASGGTVIICGETFFENLTINKSITLRGAGIANTLIHSVDNTAVTILPDQDVTIEDLSITVSLDADFAGITYKGIDNSGTVVIRQVGIYETPQGLLNQGGDVTIIGSIIRENGTGSYRINGTGIQNLDGTLRVINSTISENRGSGPIQIASGTGLNNTGIAFIKDSTIRRNRGKGTGGIYNSGEMTIEDSSVQDNLSRDGAGGIKNVGVLIIRRTTIAANIGANEDVCQMGGGIANYNELEITDSLIQGNSKSQALYGEGCLGGAIYNSGRYNSGRTTLIKNTTITQNKLRCARDCDNQGGGIANVESAILELENVTIYDNQGGGLYNESGSSITLAGSIVAGNEYSNCRNVNGEIASLGHNIDNDNSCELTATGDQQSVDPQLGPLRDNGGPTFTHALLPNSPVIDIGNYVNCPVADQRGVSRPQGAACDAGAYELETDISGDVDCDGDLDSVDALFTLQYTVDLRTNYGSCPLADSNTQLYASAGDINSDGQTDASDALIILQCAAGISNSYCGVNAAGIGAYSSAP